MEALEAIKEVKSGKIRPFYVVYGKDRYRIEQFVELIQQKLFTREQYEMGLMKYDSQETALEEIVLEAESPPFFVDYKLIIVEDSSIMCAGAKDQSKLEHKPESLLQYIEHPLESSIIVFVVNAEKLDERKKIVKQLKERRCIVAFPELDQHQLKQWMIKRASDQGRSLQPEAAELLIARVGVSMQQLAQEVDKLCIHVGPEGNISLALTQQLTPTTLDEDVFALVDSIIKLKLEQALQMYKQLLVQKEEPIKLVALIARQLRMMIQIKELEEHHYSPQQMASQIGAHPYAVKLAAASAKGFQTKQLATLLSSLAELDYGMKTGRVDKALGLELFIVSFGSNYQMSYS